MTTNQTEPTAATVTTEEFENCSCGSPQNKGKMYCDACIEAATATPIAKYRAIDMNTNDDLGPASDELADESYDAIQGAVKAYEDDNGVWQLGTQFSKNITVYVVGYEDCDRP